jgi:hypothetical protein
MKTEGEEPRYLKVDSQGRVRTPAGKREAILDEFERSGMSGPAFAEHVGVKGVIGSGMNPYPRLLVVPGGLPPPSSPPMGNPR